MKILIRVFFLFMLFASISAKAQFYMGAPFGLNRSQVKEHLSPDNSFIFLYEDKDVVDKKVNVLFYKQVFESGHIVYVAFRFKNDRLFLTTKISAYESLKEANEAFTRAEDLFNMKFKKLNCSQDHTSCTWTTGETTETYRVIGADLDNLENKIIITAYSLIDANG